ncbi:MAG: YHS domain-containing (seleno)protein [Bdellovibrionota bacterium]
MKRAESIAAWFIAVIFLQTLYFKFTGAPESKYIFETLGAEPVGRIGSGVAELIAAILLIIPRTRLYGALMGMGIMTGAIASHILFLGISIQGDGGLLFSMAVASFLASAFVVYLRRRELPLKAIGLATMILLPFVVQAKVAPNAEDKIAVHGYDPVAYVAKNTALEGKKDFEFNYQGIAYRFSGKENLELFKANPEKYVPAYGGWCAYAMAEGEQVDIDPKSFKVINGKTYLFYNGIWGDTLKKWNKNETSLKLDADKQWEKLSR